VGAAKSTKKTNSGVVYLPLAGDAPRDVLTWHDQLPYRIWVHSRNAAGTYKQLALEIAWQGDVSTPTSEPEIKLRLEMAKIRVGELSSSNISATLLRSIPVGQIMETHALMLSKQSRKIEAKKNKRVTLVKPYEMDTYNFELRPIAEARRSVDESTLPMIEPREANAELRATAKDSLLIAYVYAEQVKTGSRAAASRAANLLGIKVSLAYVGISTARKKGWLTASGINGEVSGELTKEGIAEFKRINGESLYHKHVTEVFEEMKKGEPWPM
jgi:hypothetical protein